MPYRPPEPPQPPPGRQHGTGDLYGDRHRHAQHDRNEEPSEKRGRFETNNSSASALDFIKQEYSGGDEEQKQSQKRVKKEAQWNQMGYGGGQGFQGGPAQQGQGNSMYFQPPPPPPEAAKAEPGAGFQGQNWKQQQQGETFGNQPGFASQGGFGNPLPNMANPPPNFSGNQPFNQQKPPQGGGFGGPRMQQPPKSEPQSFGFGGQQQQNFGGDGKFGKPPSSNAQEFQQGMHGQPPVSEAKQTSSSSSPVSDKPKRERRRPSKWDTPTEENSQEDTSLSVEVQNAIAAAEAAYQANVGSLMGEGPPGQQIKQEKESGEDEPPSQSNRPKPSEQFSQGHRPNGQGGGPNHNRPPKHHFGPGPHDQFGHGKGPNKERDQFIHDQFSGGFDGSPGNFGDGMRPQGPPSRGGFGGRPPRPLMGRGGPPQRPPFRGPAPGGHQGFPGRGHPPGGPGGPRPPFRPRGPDQGFGARGRGFGPRGQGPPFGHRGMRGPPPRGGRGGPRPPW